MGGEDGVVRLDHRGGDLRSGIDGELQLRLLAVVDRETFHQQRGEARSSSASKRMEEEEPLESFIREIQSSKFTIASFPLFDAEN